MSFLYAHVDKFFRNTHPQWDSEKVEFLFSIPTTWKNPNQSAEIERLVNEAGFGGDASLRRVKIAQTEAEAAAVYAAKGHYKVGLARMTKKLAVLILMQPGDVILVCDAGGGTTVRCCCPGRDGFAAESAILGRQYIKSDSFWVGYHTDQSSYMG
jgi:hypothetical protein